MGLGKGIKTPLTTRSKMDLNKGIKALLTIKNKIGLSRGITQAAIKKANITVFR